MMECSNFASTVLQNLR